ncbi:MAG: pantoate--beta-alanine ligase [Candidatus Nanopelagicales bacterium]
MTQVVHTRSGLADLSAVEGPTAVVMTMGALHEGHAVLVREARRIAGPRGRVTVTDFVNPRQFGAGEDFDRYPRTLEADVALCEEAGADIVFAPDVDEVYPPEGSPAAAIAVDPGPLGSQLEGASRPGHFAGMLTVVGKLLHVTRPDAALFGEKDYQQLVLVRAMVRALDFGVEIVGVPTVREADGLAMSSRNRYLSAEARVLAAAIPAALRLGEEAAPRGAQEVEHAVRRSLEDVAASSPVPMRVDYVAVRSVDLGDPAPGSEGRLLVAVLVDGTRLIDNVAVRLGGP